MSLAVLLAAGLVFHTAEEERLGATAFFFFAVAFELSNALGRTRLPRIPWSDANFKALF